MNIASFKEKTRTKEGHTKQVRDPETRGKWGWEVRGGGEGGNASENTWCVNAGQSTLSQQASSDRSGDIQQWRGRGTR